MDFIKERLNSPQKKFSAVVGGVLGILWFAYFVVACTYLADPINSSTLRVWVTTPDYENQNGGRVFPQFTICPHPPASGSFISLKCDNYDWYTSTLVKTLTPAYVNNILPYAPDWTCYSYNSEGADSNIDFVNCTGEGTPGVTAFHVFFDDPGSGKDFFDGYNRPPAYDNWICPIDTRNDFGWDTTDPLGGPIGEASIDNPTRQYQVNVQTFPQPNGNMTSLNIWWGSNDVWHYQPHSPFVFFHWVGFIGGAAFLLKMLYDIIMAIFKVGCPSGNPAYTEVQ